MSKNKNDNKVTKNCNNCKNFYQCDNMGEYDDCIPNGYKDFEPKDEETEEPEDMLTKVSDELHEDDFEDDGSENDDDKMTEDSDDEEESDQKPEKKLEINKDKLVTIGIYAAILIAVVCYIIFGILKPGKNNSLPAIQTGPNGETYVNQNDPYAGNPNVDSYGNLQVNPTNNMENNMLRDNYYTPAEAYVCPIDCSGNREDKYRITMPINYEMLETADGTIYIKPTDFTIYVDGNDPIELRWSGITYIDQIRNGGTFTVDNMTIQVLDSYQYQFSETATKTVYIIYMDIESTNDDDDGYAYNHRYMAIIDENPVGIQYYTAIIYQGPLTQFLNNRYPDVQTLFRAIFKPVE